MPTFVGAGSGVTVTGTVGTVSKTGCIAGNIICVHVVVNGTQNPSVGSVVNIKDFAGTPNATTPSTGAPYDVGSPQTGVQNMHWGRVMSNGTCSVDLTITSDDFVARIYEFTDGSDDTTYADVFENTAASSGIRQAVGTSTTPTAQSPAITTIGADRLGLAFVGITANVAVASMTGETGGYDWTEAVAEYSDTPGTLQLQIAPMNSAGSITAGSQTIGSSQGWAVDSTALKSLDATNLGTHRRGMGTAS